MTTAFPGCWAHLAAVAAIAVAAAAGAGPSLDRTHCLHLLTIPVLQARGAPPERALAALRLRLRCLLTALHVADSRAEGPDPRC